ncbi:MAG TPA: pyrroline-5-carboxylate reductase [Syntrophothermus lipocalidus]|nr:pyrroline-5-carboxylate reductase [Syntrophothermus lipocalidus]
MKYRVLGVVGCGNMAYALVKGLTQSRFDFETIVGFDVNPARLNLFRQEFSVKLVSSNQEVAEQGDIIVLAVKPGQIRQVLEEVKDKLTSDKLLVSIAAGISTSLIEEVAGSHVPVIRVMPNTPCLVGRGISAIAAGTGASVEHEEVVARMFAAVGEVCRVPESYMDAVTALSGSGPAYIYLVAEAMSDAGVEVGLPRDLARLMALKTIAGAVAMMEVTGKHPAVLREDVTSPGGTTIAGLRELEENGLRKAFFRAVRRAFERSMELGRR